MGPRKKSKASDTEDSTTQRSASPGMESSKQPQPETSAVSASGMSRSKSDPPAPSNPKAEQAPAAQSTQNGPAKGSQQADIRQDGESSKQNGKQDTDKGKGKGKPAKHKRDWRWLTAVPNWLWRKKASVLAVVAMVALTWFTLSHQDPSRTGGVGLPGVEFPLSNIAESFTDMMADWATSLSMTLTFNNLNTQAVGLLADWWTNRTDLAQRLNMTVAELSVKVLGQLPSLSQSSAPAPQSVTRPGAQLAAKGYKAKFPVIIIPGFVTSQLELWQGHPCAQRYFRQRMWGTLGMMQAFLLNKRCWFAHLELDPITGMDPPNIKLRAAQGMEAVDFFVEGYWVWGRLIEALADVGYTPNNLATLPFDWRLAIPNMEIRDAWFTRAKHSIESMVEVTGEKCVLASHSYGENVARALLTWADALEPGWVEKYVEAHTSIAGPVLGAPKAITALLSGEARDTAQLGALASFLTDRMAPRPSRAKLFRSWGSLLSMFPVGGPKVWGNTTWAPDDPPKVLGSNKTYGALVVTAPLRPIAAATAAAAAEAVASGHPIKSIHLPHANETCSGGDANDNETSRTCSSADGLGVVKTDNDTLTDQNATYRNGSVSWDTTSLDVEKRKRDRNAALKAALQEGVHKDKLDDEPAAADAELNAGAAPSGLASTLMGWFSASDESSASDVLDTSRLQHLHVVQARQLALEVAGPQRTEQYRQWGPRDASNLGQSKDDDVQVDGDEVPGTKHRGIPLPIHPNPLTTPLPNAPSFKWYCMYGTGVPTERAYHYIQPDNWKASDIGKGGEKNTPAAGRSPPVPAPINTEPGNESKGVVAKASADADRKDDVDDQQQCAAPGVNGSGLNASGVDGSGLNASGHLGTGQKITSASKEDGEEADDPTEGTYDWRINTALNDPEVDLISGVHMGDGDLTIPLISLGAMCQGGWQSKRLNPGGVKVLTREYKHAALPLLKDPRGGPNASSHIDILGNEEMLMDILLVVTGAGDQLVERTYSNINDIVKQIPWEDPDGWE